MKTKIAILLAGLVLGSTASGYAASSYWENRGRTYGCQGDAGGVICTELRYRQKYGMGITPRFITVTFRGNVVFGCERRFMPASNCDYYGP